MISASMLHIRKYEYSGHFNFVILFVGILPLNVIIVNVISFFVDSSFMFFMLNDALYKFELMNVSLFL
jgi:hypothetical protein